MLDWLFNDAVLAIVYKVLFLVLLLIVTAIIAKLSKILIKKAFSRSMPIVTSHAQRIVGIIIWLGGLLFAIEQIGLKTDLFLLLIGLMGIGAIIAMKDTLQNVAASYFSDVYVPFKLGDEIKVGAYRGRVIEINPIVTIVMAKNNELISIPNALLIKRIIENTTPQAWQEIIIPIIIDNTVNLMEFESKILKSCNKIKMYFDERFPPILAIRKRTKNSTELALTLMIRDVDKKDAIIAEINQRVKKVLDTKDKK